MLDVNRHWTAGALLREATRVLEAKGLPEARRAAEWMLEALFECSRAQLFAYPEREATPEHIQGLATMLARRVQREPVQYILGHADFYGMRLRITPDVLIPRPETEQVVEAALGLVQDGPPARFLDIGTGSGCIALALKHERHDAEVHACDVSEAALAVARANAAAHDLDVLFFQADVLASGFAERAPGRLDLIISNPPYVPVNEAGDLAPEVRDFEPHLALFSGNDPLRFYRAIVRHACSLLVPGGLLVFETHRDHAPEVGDLLDGAGFDDVQRRRDLAGCLRIVYARFHP
ncbi:MAG: peptide chain release factor N(5)-glutamine methyltransferase [Rhodothermales bacterium]